MWTKESLVRELDRLKSQYGEWAFDIPLPFDVWTKGNLGMPHTRLRRVLQVVSDLSRKPLAECRVLDLGCLDGIFAIEFAKHGSDTVGVEIREANVKKAMFCKEVLGLRNLEFRQDDVRHVDLDAYGRFDAIVCSGILYHLQANEAIELIDRMHAMVNRVVVIDTHVALEGTQRHAHGGEEYRGSVYREHADAATPDAKEKALLASADNVTSFWFTRPSLVNILTRAGFSSVYECFAPPHLNFGQPGLESRDRCTFVAIKDDVCTVETSPRVNALREKWPEDSLSYYALPSRSGTKPLRERILSRLRRFAA